MDMPTIKITYSDSRYKPNAEVLASKLNLPLVDSAEISQQSAQNGQTDYYLEYASDGLCLKSAVRNEHGPIRCDFNSGASTHRRKYGGGNGQAIAKAVGVSGKFAPQVLDLTAGMGGDGFVLATLGCEILLLERNPVVHSLLDDGLQRAAIAGLEDTEFAAIAARISLLDTDAGTYLKALPAEPCADIIYLDPMFPERKKSAKVKKEMQAFHGIVGGDEDASELLELSLARARYRVVVKRSSSAGYLADTAPSYSLEGKSTRFDVFALQKLPG
jgi:16S rRNA (guanine1516-N2)-methyltransferase